VLLALPALLAMGLLRRAPEFYRLPHGFYGMESIFLLLGLMALARIRSLEQLRYQAPGEWGKLLGLDRIPEVRTLRAKLKVLCQNVGQATASAQAAFANASNTSMMYRRRWTDSNRESGTSIVSVRRCPPGLSWGKRVILDVGHSVFREGMMNGSDRMTIEPTSAETGKRRRHPVVEKRRIVEETLLPGASVARVAREHGVNANQVFAWRRQYQRGLLGGIAPAAALLPVKLTDSPTAAEPRPLTGPPGSIQLRLPKGQLRVDGAVDSASLRIILECLLG
jgi:transposase